MLTLLNLPSIIAATTSLLNLFQSLLIFVLSSVVKSRYLKLKYQNDCKFDSLLKIQYFFTFK